MKTIFGGIKMKKMISLILTALMLTACASAPSEVQKENNVLDSVSEVQSAGPYRPPTSSQSKPESSLEFDTLENIRKNCQSENKSNAGNVTVKNVRVSEGQTMPVYKLGKCFENTEDIGEFIKEFYGEDLNKNKSKLCWYKDGHSEYFPESPDRYTVDTDCKGALQYRYDEKGAIYASVSACGQFVANTSGCWEHQVAGGELVSTVDIAAGEKPDDTPYKMYDGGSVTVSRAIQRAQTQVNKYLKMVYTDKMTCRVNKVEIRKMQDGAYGFEIYFEFVDAQGCIILTNQIYPDDSESFDNGSKPLISRNIAVAWVFDSKEKINFFSLNTIPLQSEIVTDAQKLLTYKSALDCVHRKLAQSVLYDLDSAVLEYVVTFPAKSGVIRRDKNAELVGFDEREYLHRKDCDAYLRPCWVFKDYSKNDGHEAVIGGLILVDALTGDVYVY